MTALTVGEMISILKNHDPSLVLVFNDRVYNEDCVIWNQSKPEEDVIKFEEGDDEDEELKVLRFKELDNDVYYYTFP